MNNNVENIQMIDEKIQKIDEENQRRNNKIASGMEVKWVRLTFYFLNSDGVEAGFAIEDYQLPFDQKLLKQDENTWKKLSYINRIVREDITEDMVLGRS